MYKVYTAEDCCWLFNRWMMKCSRGINIRKYTNFDKHRANTKKWVYYEHLCIIANKYKIDLNEYIPAVCKRYDNKFFHPKAIINPSNLQMWNDIKKSRQNVVAKDRIVREFTASLNYVVDFCVKNDIPDFQSYINYTLRTHVLGIHYASGNVNRYFIAFIPRLEQMLKYIEPDIAHQMKRLVVNHKDALRAHTITAMKELKNVKLTSVIDLVNFNIKRRNNV